MPFIHGLEADDGGDRNFNHLENAAGHSYLNTIEWVLSIANIGLANHASELDPATPPFLFDSLQHVATMQQEQNNIKEYDN
eukprot:447610-Ditylum_brightwellii.AAC.1